ncbi:MAG: NAD(+) diphosphatase [Rhodobacteraceae bacterium]|nr:NAD(+) diphosphatase [Paracoccaceae bacterium]
MKNAGTTAFGSPGLNRAADLRDKAAQMLPAADCLAIWRGKILFECKSKNLVRLPHDHALIAESGQPSAFLGLEDDGTPIFAFDVSARDAPDTDRDTRDRSSDPSRNRCPGFGNHQAFTELRDILAKLSPRDAELAASSRGLFAWHRNHGFCAKCGAATTISMAGWQRNCSTCGTAHFPRIDPVVIVLALHGNSVLLGRSPGWPEGMYSLLSGFMEPGESMEAAARREVFEESGVNLSEVGYLTSRPWPFPASLMIGCIARAETTELTVDPKEIEDARWFTREEVAASLRGANPALFPPVPGTIAHLLICNWLTDTLEQGR